MLSKNFLSRLSQAKSDLATVANGHSHQARNNHQPYRDAFAKAQNLADTWLNRVEPFLDSLSDEAAVQSLVLFCENIVRVANGQITAPALTAEQDIRQQIVTFHGTLPLLIYSLLEASGVTRLSDEDFVAKREEALRTIAETGTGTHSRLVKEAEEQRKNFEEEVAQATGNIRKTVEEAQKDLDRIKTEASRISVEKALEQFNEAAKSLRSKAWWWGRITAALFFGLVCLLVWFFFLPPAIIRQIMDSWKPGTNAVAPPVSIPLLIAASAYFTSIRLALIGILGVGLAFSLKMTRAYLHMIEHNQHKLRVTNSIEAFVAAVRLPDQKDIVLSKLVDSVTEFGDSGILGGQNEASALPSVIVGAMTKNIGKAE